MEDEDLSFLHVTDLDSLTAEEHKRRNAYWAKRTPRERLRELYRLQRAKWGDLVDQPLKRVITVIDRRKDK